MNRNPAAWSYLPQLGERHGIDVFLLQEAGRPEKVPPGFEVEPNPAQPELWKILPHRPYCSAIASVQATVTLTPRRATPLSEARVDWGEFVASHPGQFCAVDVKSPEGETITVVSLYGIWDKIPQTGQLFADATLHRAISDLAVLFDQRHADKVLAGDLNVWHAYEGSGERWARRFQVVFDRLFAHGLELLGPFRREGRPPLEGCTCGSEDCRHVDTFRYNRNPAATPYQNDFIFGTKMLQDALAAYGCFACEEDDIWEFSDHRPVVARLSFPPGETQAP